MSNRTVSTRFDMLTVRCETLAQWHQHIFGHAVEHGGSRSR
ncbi:hypothetical protein ACFC18_31255 [Streptomyces sp. NPDC056121]